MSEEKQVKIEPKEYELLSAVRIVGQEEWIRLVSSKSEDEAAGIIKRALFSDIFRHTAKHSTELPVKLARSVNPEDGSTDFELSLCLVDEKRLIDLLSIEIAYSKLMREQRQTINEDARKV